MGVRQRPGRHDRRGDDGAAAYGQPRRRTAHQAPPPLSPTPTSPNGHTTMPPSDWPRRRTAHQAPPPMSATATSTNGHTTMPPSDCAGDDAAAPGVPEPATVSSNDQEPDTTCPSAEVTR